MLNLEPLGLKKGTLMVPHQLWRNRVWIILLAVPLVALVSVFMIGSATANSSGAEPVSYGQFSAQVKDHNVSSVTLDNNSVTGIFQSPVVSDRTHTRVTTFTTTIPSHNVNVVQTLLAGGVQVSITNGSSSGGMILLEQWLPLLLLGAIPYLIIVACVALYLSGRPRPPAEHSLA
jgi:ATP-dependent Zn protease